MGILLGPSTPKQCCGVQSRARKYGCYRMFTGVQIAFHQSLLNDKVTITANLLLGS